jgi:hypothetical protein
MIIHQAEVRSGDRSAIREQYPLVPDWESRFESRVRKSPSYPQLLAQYTTAMLPDPDDLADKSKGLLSNLKKKIFRPNRSNFQCNMALDFMPLRRVITLDLQIQLREGTDYVYFGAFGNEFNPASLVKIQKTLKDYG